MKSYLLKNKDRLSPESCSTVPKVLAIGGIKPSNCHIPMTYGADGVAVIRCIMHSDDNPLDVAMDMKNSMKLEMDQLLL